MQICYTYAWSELELYIFYQKKILSQILKIGSWILGFYMFDSKAMQLVICSKSQNNVTPEL
jgi:hypothetical protein